MASRIIDCSAVDASISDICRVVGDCHVSVGVDQLWTDPTLACRKDLAEVAAKVVGLSAATVDGEVSRDLEFAAFLGLSAVVFNLDAAKAWATQPLRDFVRNHDTPQLWFRCELNATGFRTWQRLRESLGARVLSADSDQDAAIGSYCRGGGVAVLGTLSPANDFSVAWSGEHIVALHCDLAHFDSDSLALEDAAAIANGVVSVPIRGIDELDKALSTPRWVAAGCPARRNFARVAGDAARSAGAVHYLDHEEASAMGNALLPSVNVPQVPLQPLGDHLPSSTYETFERDAPKYALYRQALTDVVKDIASASKVTVYVVGAGRGPLVDAALTAMRGLPPSTPCSIVAVEKNPSAAWFLRARLASDAAWSIAAMSGRLSVVQADMRTLKPHDPTPNEAVVVVSELLGSLGDNELSPECVEGFLSATKLRQQASDGALRLVVVPATSVALVTPVGGSVLPDTLFRWNLLGRVGRGVTPSIAAEFHQMHVINSRSYHALAVGPQTADSIGTAFAELWTFNHDATASSALDIESERFRELVFSVRDDGTFSGFMGGFRSVLSRQTPPLSIIPSDHTPDMYSWFPVFLPLLFPSDETSGSQRWVSTVDVKRNDVVRLEIRRCMNSTQTAIFLTWCATVLRGGEVAFKSLAMNADGQRSIAL